VCIAATYSAAVKLRNKAEHRSDVEAESDDKTSRHDRCRVSREDVEGNDERSNRTTKAKKSRTVPPLPPPVPVGLHSTVSSSASKRTTEHVLFFNLLFLCSFMCEVLRNGSSGFVFSITLYILCFIVIFMISSCTFVGPTCFKIKITHCACN